MSWGYIRGWDCLPVWEGTGPNYPHGNKHYWIDGIHIKESAAKIWLDLLIANWFEESIHRRLVVEVPVRRPENEWMTERGEHKWEMRRPPDQLVSVRPETQVRSPAIEG
jgi:hypothetical protein